jgi:hypothetical protein
VTFKEIQDDAMERLNLTSADARTRVKRYVNEWYRRILGRLGMSRLRDASSTTIILADGQAEYDVSAVKIAHIFDPTNEVMLVERSLTWMRDMDPTDSYRSNYPVAFAVRKVGATTLKVRVWPIPNQALTLRVDTSSGATALSADGDVPVLPEDYHWILSLAARVSEYEKLDDDRYKIARQDLEDAIRELRYHIAKSHTKQWSQGEPGLTVSRFGSAFTE